LLDRFMPVYEVVERHHVRVAAPAELTLSAACGQNLLQSPMVRGIFRAREIVLGATSDNRVHPRGLLAFAQSLGWRVLAGIPGREIVLGAVTKTWEPDVTFRPVPPDEFAAFAEPGYVKIVWTLRADSCGPDGSTFRTETRVSTTDTMSRARFRRYWAFFSPGIRIIRWMSLGSVKRDAERMHAQRTRGPRFDQPDRNVHE
jgi:hypothetical protein